MLLVDDVTITETSINGIGDQSVNEGLRIYPNPATDYIVVDLPAGISSQASITVIDVLGKVVSNQTIDSGASMTLTGSKLFRDGTVIANLDATKTTYEDVNPGNGYHTYFVQKVYSDGSNDHLSTPSNLVTIGLGVTGIVSKPASGKLQLYPNPAHDMLTLAPVQQQPMLSSLLRC